MLEFILDFILEILFEGTVYLFETKRRVPLPIRIFAGVICAILYIGFGGICLGAGVLALVDKEIAPGIIFVVLGLFIFIGGFREMRKGMRRRNEE